MYIPTSQLDSIQITSQFSFQTYKNVFRPMPHCFSLLKPAILEDNTQVEQFSSVQFSSVQLLSHVWLFATPCTAAHQASLSITNSQSLLKLMSIELVRPSNHLILCHSLLLPPSLFLSIRVFSNESLLCIRWPKYWSFIFNISPYNEYSGLISLSGTVAFTKQYILSILIQNPHNSLSYVFQFWNLKQIS